MNKTTINDTIELYIEEVRGYLPYSDDMVYQALNELKKDVQDAMGSDKRPPSVVFGSPKEVALNLSRAQDWDVQKATWFEKSIAFFIDFLILTPITIFFLVLPLIYFFPDRNALFATVDSRIIFMLVNVILGIPVLILMLIYFTFLEKNFGTTIGKKIMGLLVIDESGIKITWSQAILRNLTKTPLTGQFLIFDVLIGMLSDKTKKKNQRVFDLVSNTIIIKQTN